MTDSSIADRPAILYTQAGCADGTRVRAWLTERGVAFTERDVTAAVGAAQALCSTGTFATPLLVAGERTVLGFRPDALAATPARSAGAPAADE